MPNFDEDWIEEIIDEQYPHLREKYEQKGKLEGRLEGRLEGKLEGKLEVVKFIIGSKGCSFDEACEMIGITDDTRIVLRKMIDDHDSLRHESI